MFAAASSHPREATDERAISTLGTSCEERYHKFAAAGPGATALAFPLSSPTNKLTIIEHSKL